MKSQRGWVSLRTKKYVGYVILAKVIVLHITMYVFQANRTAYLVHRLLNVSDDLTLKKEVMIPALEVTYIYSNTDSWAAVYVSFCTAAIKQIFMGTNCVLVAQLIAQCCYICCLRRADSLAETDRCTGCSGLYSFLIRI
jgi:hypothetical protein